MLEGNWTFIGGTDGGFGKLEVTLQQTQKAWDTFFELPSVELAVLLADGSEVIESVRLAPISAPQQFELLADRLQQKPQSIRFDPNNNLLFEGDLTLDG